MENQKPLILSETFWGSLVALAGAMFQIFGVDITTQEIQPVANALMVLIGFVLTIHGRFTAKERISGFIR